MTLVSWNMAEQAPTDEDCSFLKQYRNNDFVVFAIQECEDIRPRRNEGHRSRKWKELQSKSLGRSFRCFARHKLGGLLVAVYGKQKLSKQIEGIQVIDVACGVGNVLTNKGAICVAVRMRGKTFAVVNCHFAAHQSQVSERNADFRRVLEAIDSRLQPSWRTPSSALLQIAGGRGEPRPEKSGAPKRVGKRKAGAGGRARAGRARAPSSPALSDLYPQLPRGASPTVEERQWQSPFDAVAFVGDFNYRLDLPRLEIELVHEALAARGADQGQLESTYAASQVPAALDTLLLYDQLQRQRGIGEAFAGFREGPLLFPPSFKYDRENGCFDSSSKRRVPAWTDRVMFDSAKPAGTGMGVGASKSAGADGIARVAAIAEGLGDSGSAESPSALRLVKYYSVDSRTSDHRPVCADFALHL
ncbi:Endonuclease/exonuclease/phosphatase [Ochromonadaceae sp. CCMP2298]|nr:Endonuclease/exonuclease/phosphatase [Ochromonadaceae sp. CCMP2298]